MPLQVPASLPAGSISPFAGAVAPDGWLLMGGQAVSRTTYAALFLAIGTVYGAGDGLTTFNLPDARGRVLFGKDDMGGTPANRVTVGGSGIAGVTLGANGGGESVTLTAAQMPSHNHLDGVGNAQFSGRFGQAAGTGTAGLSNGAFFGNTTSSNLSETKGSGGAHSNMPPAMVVNYIIKT